MARPYSRAQALQNAAFLKELARTGNARDAARTLGLNRSMLTKRRNADPDFAQRWESALALAAAALADTNVSPDDARLVRSKGRLQLRATRARHIDTAAEQAFLRALTATANVRLAASAAGFAHSSFYARARRHPGFAREMRLALAVGAERLEMALLESGLPEANVHDQWRHNDPPPIEPMTVHQAMLLVAWNDRRQKELVNPAFGPKRGESNAAWKDRCAREYRVEKVLDEEERRLVSYAQLEWRRGGRREEWEPLTPDEDLLAAIKRVRWGKASR
ncbi:hypothetical protein [Sphingomonas sp. Leaf25]|uniref:hypothetical protein n=1 Tax=Sphingomonas sp. Leaf25 TaxID=1735692 RepID=UPI0007011FF9|nr:hypothetical protein [Sphingomonas sp. Leaf25]KQN03658.1 hypothetical protein ASE78_00815 [Sphingomonas sp. Leaf25]